MKILRPILVLLCVGLFLIMPYAIVSIAEDIDTYISTISLTIPATCQLSMSDGNITESLSADGSSEAYFDQGYYDCVATDTLTLDANKPWELKIKVSTDWGQVGSYQKDTGDLKLKITSSAGHQTGFSDFASLYLTDQQIATHSAGVSAEQYACSYRIMLDWMKDIPGTYQISVTLTLSTNAS